jgi:hypothetical protein
VCPTHALPELSEGCGAFELQVYCAAVICHLLGDWSGMDVPLCVDYIHRSQAYDGGYGLGPGLEAHGGSTYCAVILQKRLLFAPALFEIEFTVKGCMLIGVFVFRLCGSTLHCS